MELYSSVYVSVLLLRYRLIDWSNADSVLSVLASPVFYDLYLQFQEELLTNFTVRKLAQRGLDFFGDDTVHEVNINVTCTFCEAAYTLRHLCQKHAATNEKSIIRCPIHIWKALLKVQHGCGWPIE